MWTSKMNAPAMAVMAGLAMLSCSSTTTTAAAQTVKKPLEEDFKIPFRLQRDNVASLRGVSMSDDVRPVHMVHDLSAYKYGYPNRPTPPPTPAPTPPPTRAPVVAPISGTVKAPGMSKSQPAMTFDSFTSFFLVTFQGDIGSLTLEVFEQAVLALIEEYNNLPEVLANPDVRVIEEVEFSFEAPDNGGGTGYNGDGGDYRRKLQRGMIPMILIITGRCRGCGSRSRFTTSPGRSRLRDLQEEDGDEALLPSTQELSDAYDICISAGHIDGLELVQDLVEARTDQTLADFVP